MRSIDAKAPGGTAPRIGFLFNHDQIHQIAHSLPIALALAARGYCEVVIASSNARLRAEIERQAGAAKDRLTFVDLDTSSLLSRSLEGALGKLLPARKVLIFRDNLAFFRSLDLLVVTERTSLLLKTRYGLKRPLMVLADHGAGDRAIGFGAQTARFDLILAAGPKIRDRLMRDAGVDPARVAITGYPKFDAFPDTAPRLPMQANGRPTVVYNPHPSPHLSSWYAMGPAVLDFFLASARYNLIFAPHVMLFQRRFAVTIDKLRIARTGSVAPRFRSAPNILVDTGSVASTDMTYVRAADIYLGDASSQIYEFLERPRPCVFLNPHGYAWRDDPNFAHWQAGPVVERTEQLGGALDEAVRLHEAVYRPIQQRLFDYTFSRDGRPAAERAADAITGLAVSLALPAE
jgi:hypothetical protein